MKRTDISGVQYNQLTAVERLHKNQFGAYFWRFSCSCGKTTVTLALSVVSGKTKSCGCLFIKTITKHGDHKTRLYKIWWGIKERCLNENSSGFKNYGGRGITVCERWLNYDNFKTDMGASHDPGLTLDRIDVNGNYEQSNCRWADRETQCNNTRYNVFLNTPWGKITLAQCARKIGINATTLRRRMKKQMPDNILFGPIITTRQKRKKI